MAMTSTIVAVEYTDFALNSHDRHVSFLPLSHIFERVIYLSLFAVGASICYFGGDVLKIKEDWALFKPTIIAIVPRLLTRIYATVKGLFDQATGLKKSLISNALSSKLSALHSSGST